MLKLISDLVSFKTVYPDFEEFDKCFAYIKKYFQNTTLYIEEFEFDGFKSLAISNTDSRNLDIIFCGHLDVVPANDNLFKVHQEEDLLYGRGTLDMKGQVAVMMQLIKDLNSDKKIALFLTSDEEIGGLNGVKRLIENQSYSCKISIVPDGGFNYTLVTEAKGILHLKITVTGKESHSSELWKGENAIVKLFNIYNKIILRYPLPKNNSDWITSVNLAKIEGGNTLNKVPDSASMNLDIRHIYSDKKAEIIEYIKGVDKEMNLEIIEEGDTFFVDEENLLVKKFLEVCSTQLGYPVKKVKFPAASDARYFSAISIPCIVMNPIGENIHCNDEHVNIQSLYKLLEIYKQYINTF